MERQYFGTDGIRGLANRHPLTPELALRLGKALALLFRQAHPEPRIIIGKDTRRSGYMFETALTAGITSMGGHALLLGPLPTPSVAYHIRGMRAQGGVMISASHNPFEDNGMKIFNETGFKLDDEKELLLEQWMQDPDLLESKLPGSRDLGKASRMDDALGRYLGSLKSLFSRSFDLHGMKIVFDGANGAAYDVGPKLFRELGAEVFTMACEPNGFNINLGGGQQDLQLVGKKVLECGADIGISVDGDADRLQIVDETGAPISGEHFIYEMAIFLKAEGRLPGNGVVTTAMSNQSLVEALTRQGISCEIANVGDRYVLNRLQQKHYIFGGENSGHFLFLDQNTTADSLFSALEVLALLRSQNRKASSLRKAFSLFPQKLVSVVVKEKKPLAQTKKLGAAISELEKKYDQKGRVQVRYSGTQSVLRLMLEGPELLEVEKDLAILVQMAEEELGVG
jgi:phosphoglucosamine mutase